MNQREKVLLSRIYGCVNGISGLRARNPADIKTISAYHSETKPILQSIGFAISDLGFGDYEQCVENLEEVEAVLDRIRRESR